ncbi:MAG TPA: hypothetical protein VMX54_20775 [Vicinamibacteria bacterium]|nr:hypothetical protein [Vicinamibacteria bacterium]
MTRALAPVGGLVSSLIAVAAVAAPAPQSPASPLPAELGRVARGTPVPGLLVSFAPAARGCEEVSIVSAAAGPVLRCRPDSPGGAASLCDGAAATDLTGVLSTVADAGVFTRAFPEEKRSDAVAVRFRLADVKGAVLEKTFHGTPATLAPLVDRLEGLGRACAAALAAGTPPAAIGVATMQADGTIVLDLTATSAGARGEARLVYPPGHAEYQSVLAHLGGLRPGETKPVPPWR